MSLQVLINGLITGSLYALVALGFSLIYNASKLFHIAHGAIYTAAVYCYIGLLPLIIILFPNLALISIIITAILSLVIVALISIIFEKFVYYPLYEKNASPLVTFISSLGLYIVTVNLIALYFGNETKILSPVIEPSVSIAGAIVTRIQIIQICLSVIFIGITFYVLKNTLLGRYIRALSDNPTLVSVLGYDVKKIRILVIVIGSILAAAASLLTAYDVGINPQVGLPVVITGVVSVIVGGVRSHVGAVTAAIIIGISQNIATWYTSAQWQDMVTFIILIVVLLVRREGIVGTKLRFEEQ